MDFENLIADSKMAGRLADPIKARQYIQGGNATITLRSCKTGDRFTYKISKVPDDASKSFVAVLTGPDNSNSYQYLGMLRRGVFMRTKGSRISDDAVSHLAFKWSWEMLAKNHMPRTLEIWHEGVCGRCGRKLTVPASIESGFGPECITKIGM